MLAKISVFGRCLKQGKVDKFESLRVKEKEGDRDLKVAMKSQKDTLASKTTQRCGREKATNRESCGSGRILMGEPGLSK